MPKIRINLLGKKKAKSAFGLNEALEKYGIKADDVAELKMPIVRLLILLVGVYFANSYPAERRAEQLQKLNDEANALSQQLEEKQKELANKKEVRKQMDQLNKEESDLQAQINAVDGLKSNRGVAFRALNKLYSLIPNTVWLETLNYSGGKFQMSGQSWEYFAINEFVAKISQYTEFRNVNYKGLRLGPAKKIIPGVPEVDQKTKLFDLQFDVNGGN